MFEATVTASTGSHETSFTYDSRGSVLSQKTDGLGVTSTYDQAGGRLTAKAFGFSGLEDLHFARDDLGRASTISRYQAGAAADSIVDYDFFGADRIEAATYGNGTESSRTFTGAREERDRRFTLAGSGTLLTGFEYGRTNAGRVTGVARLHEGGAGDHYRYTAGEAWVDRVVRGVATPLDSAAVETAVAGSQYDELIAFTHDVAGNWLSRTTNGDTEDFLPNALNQYTSVGGQAYTYDDNGNLRSNGTYDLVYDVFGELVRVTGVGTGTLVAEYEYDALGQVVARHTQATTEKYVYDGSFVAATLDDSNALQRQVVFNDAAVDIPVLLRISDGSGGFDEYFYQRDGIGSVVALADSGGNVVERYLYDAYGRVTITDAGGSPRSSSAYGNRLMFASRPHDPDTGLINMRARWYSPDIGRFLSPDPAGLVDGTNLYAYASNDPVNFFDPSGLARQATQDNPGLGNSDQSLLALQSLLATFRAKVRSYLRGETAFNAEQINGLIHGYAVDLGTSLLDALPIGSGPFADAARAYAAAQISVAVSAVDLAGGLLATVADPISIVRSILRLGEGSAMGMQEIQRGNVVMGVSMITAEVAAVVGLAAGGVAGARAIAGGPVGAAHPPGGLLHPRRPGQLSQ
jgi:RHS repeat-associated protein